MAPRAPHVVVVGGGVTGLATAWFLKQGHPGLDVVVREASDRLGGKIHTSQLVGEPFDVGADAFLFRQPEFADLCDALGLGDDLVAPLSGQVWLWRGDRMRPLPTGTLLGIPTDFDVVEASGVLSEEGMSRARGEAYLGPPDLGPQDDPTIAEFVESRYGTEVVERLVDPLLSGIYAGDTRRLGLRSAAPAIASLADQAVQAGWTMTQVADVRRETGEPDARPVFKTVRGGLGRVVEALATNLDVHLESPIQTLAFHDGLWHVDGQMSDAVVLAVPAWAATGVVAAAAPKLASMLDKIEYAGAAVVALALPADTQLPEGSGMLFPRETGRLVKAVTWSSRKWPHLASREHVSLRASVGRITDHRHDLLSDLDVLAQVTAELREAFDVRMTPVDATVNRWPRALPQYDSGHLARVADLRAAADEVGLIVAGAAYDGVGLPACVRSAKAAAHQVERVARL